MTGKRHPRHYEKSIEILNSYDGQSPFPVYLNNLFKTNRNWGSKDRRSYRELCYLMLKNNRLFEHLNESQKLQLLKDLDNGVTESDAYPYEKISSLISPAIQISELKNWYHEQPPVFFFPWNNNTRLEHLEGIFIESSGSWLFSDNIDLAPFISSGHGIIQDISSTLMVKHYAPIFEHKKVWDCCSGSGGKALMMSHLTKNTELTCSDIRRQIIENLKSRFIQNKLKTPNVSVLDVSKPIKSKAFQDIEVVLADVPCTGSGTWRRNPEVLAFFQTETLKEYAERQLNILREIVKINSVRTIVYCTCSIFSEENENLIESFLREFDQYECLEQHYHGEIKNSGKRGDFLFSARLERKENQ